MLNTVRSAAKTRLVRLDNVATNHVISAYISSFIQRQLSTLQLG